MPILPIEPYIFPEDLLVTPEGHAEPACRWWVFHTLPRAEKCLARRLLSHNIRFFLPLYHRVWRRRDRLRESYKPLFPGYIFLQAGDQDWYKLLKLRLVARSIPVPDQSRLQQDLYRVFQLMTAGLPLAPEDRLVPGSWVEITAGPLAGLTGRFLRRGKRCKVFVEVEFLQRGVSVEIESWSIRPLDD
jgi:transcription antitermination factor NusG